MDADPRTDWTAVTPTAFGEPRDVPDIAALPVERRHWARQARLRSQARALSTIAVEEGPAVARAALLQVAETEGREVFERIIGILHEDQRGHAQAS